MHAETGLRGLCHLLRVIIEFNKGNYSECLNELRKLIIENPKAPSDIWFALGLCYYRTDNLPKAKLSFEKTLELDPQNAMALTSLGILEQVLGQNDKDSMARATKFFLKAFEINPRNPLVLKYLAEHLFFKGEFALCKDFCNAAQQILQTKVKSEQAEQASFRQEIQLLKSNFFFIMGKTEHQELNFQSAFENYQQALKFNPKNYEAHLCMAKCQFYLDNYHGAELSLQ